MKDYKDLLTITKPKKCVSSLEIWMEWDSNDADYIERTEIIDPDVLFKNKKLILCLAYISAKWDCKGHGWNDSAFGHHVTENRDIYDLTDILAENKLVIYSEYGLCHSCVGMGITYFDENGMEFKITFDKIYEHWKNLTYQEICDEINNAPDAE